MRGGAARAVTLAQPLTGDRDMKTKRHAGLPDVCYAVHPADDCEVVAVKNGEMGYWPVCEMPTPERAAGWVARMNGRLGVTAAQAEAMQAGSVFGFHLPIVDALLGEVA